MRPTSLLSALLLIACTAGTAHAGDSVKVISSDEKLNCRFIKFVKTNGTDGKSSALKAALDRAAGYGANGFYVMNSVGGESGSAEVDGQALDCRG